MTDKEKAVESILQILNEFELEEWEEILQEIEFVRRSKLDAKRFCRAMEWLGLKKYFEDIGSD